jgi:hypothetical protein
MQGYCWLVTIARAVTKSDDHLPDYPRLNLRTYDHLSAIVAALRPTMTRAREDPLLQGSDIMWNTWAALCESAENRSPSRSGQVKTTYATFYMHGSSNTVIYPSHCGWRIRLPLSPTGPRLKPRQLVVAYTFTMELSAHS